MRVAVLYSGGKDSTIATADALSHGMEVVALLQMRSDNTESYMFHTPVDNWVHLQAKAMRIPLMTQQTQGVKEQELDDLHKLIDRAKHEYGVQGIVTGAVASIYQASRVQRICAELDLWCFNPLWLIDQRQLLQRIVDEGYDVRIVAVAGYPLDVSWLNRRIDAEVISQLIEHAHHYGLNPAGEGGEIETFVVDAAIFNSRIQFTQVTKQGSGNCATLSVQQAQVVTK